MKKYHAIVLFFGNLLVAGLLCGQDLVVTSDTVSGAIETYDSIQVLNDATLTLDGANWSVNSGNLDVGLANNSAGHLLLTNNACLSEASNIKVASPSSGDGTSSLIVADSEISSPASMSIGAAKPAFIDISGNSRINTGLTLQHGTGYIRDGARLELDNKSVRTAIDYQNATAKLTITGPDTCVMMGMGAGGSMTISRGSSSEILITDGAVVTNYSVALVDVYSGKSRDPGCVTGRLTVATGARLYTQGTISVGTDGTGASDPGTVGELLITDPGTTLRCTVIRVRGFNEEHSSHVVISNGAEVVAASQVDLGNGRLEIFPGSELQIYSHISVYADTCGTFVNNGGTLVFNFGAPYLNINTYGQEDRLITRNGTVGFRGRNEADVHVNTAGALSVMNFEGTNAFLLDSSSNMYAPTSQDYIFDSGLGGGNFVKLIMQNNSTYRKGTATFGSGGSLWLEGGTNTFNSVCTSSGLATLAGGSVDFKGGFQNTGRLEGDGEILGAVTQNAGSTLAPGMGSEFGTLAFANSCQLVAAATVECKVGNSGEGDALEVKSGATLNLADAVLDIVPQVRNETGDSWVLIKNNGGTINGTFAEPSVMVEFEGQEVRYDIEYNDGPSNDVVLRCYRPAGTVIMLR